MVSKKKSLYLLTKMTYDKQDKLMHYIFDSRYNDMKETFIKKKKPQTRLALCLQNKNIINSSSCLLFH